jgi:hypothetical protein
MTSKSYRAHIAPFPIEHAIEDCVIARRNFYLGLWAGRTLGLSGDAHRQYACSVVAADYEETGRDDVIRKLMRDFTARGVAIARAEIEQEMRATQIMATRHFAMSD